MPHPLDSVIGPNRPLGIGITPDQYRSSYVRKPGREVLERYSTNPRNQTGLWYEDHIRGVLGPICERLQLQVLPKSERWIRDSKVYLSDKVVDVVVKRGQATSKDREQLGLELKFLGGTGSLVDPKSFVDAADFTNRPFYCLYVIDGEGWLEGKRRPAVNYLAHWWDLTCSAYLERTLANYFR